MTCVVTTELGVVDSDDGRSSAVGRAILERGGNAVDAAVAVALALGVINQGSSGLGGGSFMLVRMINNEGKAVVRGFDMRETAPSVASESYYMANRKDKEWGARSVAVPGELKGLHEAWKMFGSKKLEWKELVKPATRFAEEGFTISPYLYYQMTQVENEKIHDIRADPGMRAIYMRNGQLLKPGDVCKNPQLAATLKAIADHGSDVFYKGKVGESLVQDIREAGGFITERDLVDYKVEQKEHKQKGHECRYGLTNDFSKEVISEEDVMGLHFLTMPPPASGGAGMILMLNILQDYGSRINDDYVWRHRFIESCKHMFAVRSHIGDPKYDTKTQLVVEDMLSKTFAGKLRRDISDDKTCPPDHYGGWWKIDNGDVIYDHGTSHISIVDKHRNAVALTCSVNYHFGSRFLSQRTGILLNNTMDDFILPRKPNNKDTANRIKPNKRPLSSMAPTIILKNGELKAVVGSSGGFRIIGGTTQVVLNHFARGMAILNAIMKPRIFHQLLESNGNEAKIEYEEWFTAKNDQYFAVSKDEQKYLESKGHKLKLVKENNMCQCIEVQGTHITGASDPRKGSYPDTH